MIITIQRPPISDSPTTVSTVLINGVYFCDSLEDRDRGLFSADTLSYISSVKVKHETAIPYGTYQVVMSFSNKFQKYLPELLDVPGFAGIRIHAGNTQVDTSGCLLMGTRTNTKLVNSRTTVAKLISTIQSVVKREKIFIEILPSPPTLLT